MAEAVNKYADPGPLRADGDREKGEVIQLSDGRCGLVPQDTDDQVTFLPVVDGAKALRKTAGVMFVKGDEVWWSWSNDSATYRPSGSRDFYCGTSAEDVIGTAATVLTNLNARPSYKIDLVRDAFESTPVGTLALGGFGLFYRGGLKLRLDATSEAQKIDALSKESFAAGTPAVVDIVFSVVSDGAGATPDVSIGVASDTHASDADLIAQSCFIHLDGNATPVKAESDDATTDTPATSTGSTYTEGATNRVYCKIDLRVPSSVKFYVNGQRVLTATTFDVSAAALAWKALVHLEKTTGTDTYELDLERLTVRTMEQE